MIGSIRGGDSARGGCGARGGGGALDQIGRRRPGRDGRALPGWRVHGSGTREPDGGDCARRRWQGGIWPRSDRDLLRFDACVGCATGCGTGTGTGTRTGGRGSGRMGVGGAFVIAGRLNTWPFPHGVLGGSVGSPSRPALVVGRLPREDLGKRPALVGHCRAARGGMSRYSGVDVGADHGQIRGGADAHEPVPGVPDKPASAKTAGT